MAEELFTWVTDLSGLPPDRIQRMRVDLDGMRSQFGRGAPLPLTRISTLHFANITLFDDGRHADAPVLVFEHCIDKPYAAYVHTLVAECRPALDRIYQGCPGYPDAGRANAEVVDYFSERKRKRQPQLFHIGHPDRSVKAIRGDYELRRSLACALATDRSLKSMSPAQVVRTLRRRARCPRMFRGFRAQWRPWHKDWNDPPKQDAKATPLETITWEREWPSLARWRRAAILLIAGWVLGVALILALQQYVSPEVLALMEIWLTFGLVRSTSADARIARGALVAGLLGLFVYLASSYLTTLTRAACDPERVTASFPTACQALTAAPWLLLIPALLHLVAFLVVVSKLTTTADLPRLDPDEVARLLDAEDRPEHGIYNHVAGLSPFRDDRWLRRLRTRAVLALLNMFYRTQFVKGQLSTIPSIHFASWTLVNKPRQCLLFVVNYHGGADLYLDDFFDSLAKGVAFIWHDTLPYPRTTDSRVLKAWVRQSQTLASVRYRAGAYANLTVAAINNNTHIRKRLLRGCSDKTARRFLQRFTSTLPEDPSILDVGDRWLRRIVSID